MSDLTLENADTIVPTERQVAQASQLLTVFGSLAGLSEAERMYPLNQILSCLLGIPTNGHCIYVFSGDDLVYTRGLSESPMVYADNDRAALTKAKTEDPRIETLETNLLGGLPKELDRTADMVVERSFCGQSTFTAGTFARSIKHGGFYLLWGAMPRSGGVTLTHLDWMNCLMDPKAKPKESVSQVLAWLQLPDSLREQLAISMGLPLETATSELFRWQIHRIVRH